MTATADDAGAQVGHGRAAGPGAAPDPGPVIAEDLAARTGRHPRWLLADEEGTDHGWSAGPRLDTHPGYGNL